MSAEINEQQSAEAAVVALDSRGRINLTPFAPVSRTYFLHSESDGTIVLVPAKVVPVREFLALQQQSTAPVTDAAEQQ